MQAQLHLLNSGAEKPPAGPVDPAPGAPRDVWRIDDHTRDVGRQGLVQARAALREARRNHRDEAGAAA